MFANCTDEEKSGDESAATTSGGATSTKGFGGQKAGGTVKGVGDAFMGNAGGIFGNAGGIFGDGGFDGGRADPLKVWTKTSPWDRNDEAEGEIDEQREFEDITSN